MTYETEVDGNISYEKVQPATRFTYGAGNVWVSSIREQFQDLLTTDG